MCCSCELCTPNVFVFCSEGHKVWPQLAPEKHSRSLQTSSSSLSLPQEPSCPGLHTHTGSLSVIPASRDEPVFDDSPPAERIGWEGSTNSPYLTTAINNCFIKKVSNRVFLDLLSSDHRPRGPPLCPVWIKVLGGRQSTPLWLFCSRITYFLNHPVPGLNSPAAFYRFFSFFHLSPPSASSGCNKACSSSLIWFFFFPS